MSEIFEAVEESGKQYRLKQDEIRERIKDQGPPDAVITPDKEYPDE